jgi:hypothetical protein
MSNKVNRISYLTVTHFRESRNFKKGSTAGVLWGAEYLTNKANEENEKKRRVQ